MKRKVFILSCILLISCSNNTLDSSLNTSTKEEEMKIKLSFNNLSLNVLLENNKASDEFYKILNKNPLTIALNEYGGFEKVGDLGFSLPSEDKTITTKEGDLILYNSNQISLMYGSNTWSYTRLGSIENINDISLKDLLGNGDVTVTFSL